MEGLILCAIERFIRDRRENYSASLLVQAKDALELVHPSAPNTPRALQDHTVIIMLFFSSKQASTNFWPRCICKIGYMAWNTAGFEKKIEKASTIFTVR